MPTLGELLARAAELSTVSDTARLDTELLLAHALGKPRAHLYAWPEAVAPAAVVDCFGTLMQRRLAGEPVAYLLGEREFCSLPLQVTPAVLIPRPDTELLVEATLARLPAQASVVDLGTGSGAIALALAAARPAWQVTAVERAPDALTVATANATALGLPVRFLGGDWCAPLADERFDAVISNPPYIAPDDPHLAAGDVRFEPRAALVANEGGFADLFRIAREARAHLVPGGRLLLEHGATQGPVLAAYLAELGYDAVETLRDLAGLDRVTLGVWRLDAD